MPIGRLQARVHAIALSDITLGKAAYATGVAKFTGTTSGVVSVTTAAAAGTWTFTLPTSGGTANFAMTTNGSGTATWVTGQSIAGLTTADTPQFARIGLGMAADASIPLSISGFGDGRVIAALTGGTGYKDIQLNNTGADARFGVESSAGGAIITGTSAYAVVVGTAAAVALQFATSNVVQLSIASTGVATFTSTVQVVRLGVGAAADGTIPSIISYAGELAMAFSGQTTGAQYLRIANTGGSYFYGVESSAGSRIITGSLAYAFALATPTGKAFQVGDGAGVTATFLSQQVGIGVAAPTATFHLKAGTATANTAPIKFNAGTLLTTPELGALEFTDDGTTGHLYITRSLATVVTRTQIV